MIVKKIAFSRLSMDEINTTATTIVSVCDNFNDPYLKSLCDKVVKTQAELSSAAGFQSRTEYRQLIDDMDSLRDRKFLAFRHFVKGYSLTDEEPQASAAAAVLQRIEERGYSLHSLSNTEESSALTILFDDLAKIPTEIAAMPPVFEQLEKLKKAQAAFEEVVNRKVTDNSNKNTIAAIDCRKKLAFLLKSVCGHVASGLELDANLYEPLAESLNKIITPLATALKLRQTLKENKAKPE